MDREAFILGKLLLMIKTGLPPQTEPVLELVSCKPTFMKQLKLCRKK